MSTSPWLSLYRPPTLVSLLCFGILFAIGFQACSRGEDLPDVSSQTYRDAVAAFQTGLAAIQSSAEIVAEQKMQRVTELVPQEPAAWANLGLLAFRRTAFDLAAERLKKARALAPESSQIQILSGLFERMQGRLQEAKAYLQRAVDLDPHNLKALYALAQLTEQQGGEPSSEETGRLLRQLLEAQRFPEAS